MPFSLRFPLARPFIRLQHCFLPCSHTKDQLFQVKYLEVGLERYFFSFFFTCESTENDNLLVSFSTYFWWHRPKPYHLNVLFTTFLYLNPSLWLSPCLGWCSCPSSLHPWVDSLLLFYQIRTRALILSKLLRRPSTSCVTPPLLLATISSVIFEKEFFF